MLGGCIEKPDTHLRGINIMVDIIETKKCRTCQKVLSFDKYYKTGRNGRWLMLDCKICFHAARRNLYKNDPVLREKIHQLLLCWRRSHKEQTNATCSKWHKENRDKIAPRRNRDYHLHKHDPIFKMIKMQRSRVYKTLKRNNIPKDEPTIILLGCSAVQLKEYLAGKFKEGMTWENHGRLGWHVDHIKPLASFDFRDESQIMVAFHYTNLQPLWWYENLKKGDKAAVA